MEKVELKTEDPTLRSVTFIISNEDHTIANALKEILNQNEEVSFVGYTIPHPLEPFVNFRVQMYHTSTMTSVEALLKAIQDLKELTQDIAHKFSKAHTAMLQQTAAASLAMSD